MKSQIPVDPLNLAYVESLYTDYLRDPTSALPEWEHYFAGLANREPAEKPFRTEPSFPSYSLFNPPSVGRDSVASREEPGVAGRQERVDALVRSYRTRGHIIAQVDPLRQPKMPPPELDPAYRGLTEADFDRPFACATMEPDRVLSEKSNECNLLSCGVLGINRWRKFSRNLSPQVGEAESLRA